jgi:thiol-disulfide isomerase/thioredoxin
MHKYLIFCFLVLFSACKNSATTNTNDAATKPAAAKLAGHARQPLRTVGQPPHEVGVYNFAAFSPFLLPPNNDTLYIINFWATWCAPCVAELPFFIKAAEANKAQPVKIILVSFDFEKDLDTRLVTFLENKKIPLEVIALVEPDANSWLPKIDPDWDGALPATLAYRGSRRGFFAQSFEQMQLDSLITSFLAKQ